MTKKREELDKLLTDTMKDVQGQLEAAIEEAVEAALAKKEIKFEDRLNEAYRDGQIQGEEEGEEKGYRKGYEDGRHGIPSEYSRDSANGYALAMDLTDSGRMAYQLGRAASVMMQGRNQNPFRLCPTMWDSCIQAALLARRWDDGWREQDALDRVRSA